MIPFASASQPSPKTKSIPAPIGGWNARDELSAMAPTDAKTLNNYYPSETGVTLRKGSETHATGVGDQVQTLMPYATGSTTELKAAGNGKIFDVTSSGAVGTAEVSGLNNTKFQHVNFTNSGGSFLWVCNGVDQERYYNGSTWATATLNNISAGDVINVDVHVSRLFFVLKNSLKYGYLAVNAISGDVSVVNLGSVFKEGGYLVACATWSRDGGSGPDDMMAFITSKGEIALYSGTDPDSASTWAKVGVFKIGAPIGNRCYFKVAGDLVIITQDGYMPMSRVLSTDRVSPELALSDKISGAVRDAVRQYGSSFGWQCLLYPKAGYGIFNVPRSTGIYDQHVVNTTTGAWCKFTDWNGACWAVHDDELYFGDDDGNVVKADTGFNDDDNAILGDVETAFNYFGSSATKRFTMIRPVLQSDGAIPISIGFSTDFETRINTYNPSTITTGGTKWGDAWGSPWGRVSAPVKAWRSVSGIGKAASVRIRTSTSAQGITWQSTDFMWEEGAGL